MRALFIAWALALALLGGLAAWAAKDVACSIRPLDSCTTDTECECRHGG